MFNIIRNISYSIFSRNYQIAYDTLERKKKLISILASMYRKTKVLAPKIE